MKKILTLLGSITVLASASVTVACQPTMTVTLDQVWNKEFKNKLDTGKTRAHILDLLKEKLPKSIIETIDFEKSVSENITTRLQKSENNDKKQTIKLVVNNKPIELEIGNVKLAHQSIKYIDTNGNTQEKNKEEWLKMVWVDPKKKKIKKEVSDIKEIIQMGYYDDEGENYLKPFNKHIEYVQAFEMPKNVAKISALLPREVNSLSKVFQENVNDKIEGIENWDVSGVCQMSFLFYKATKFDHNITDWNVKILRDANSMFREAENFKQDLGKWRPSSLAYASRMFYQAKQFNANINTWDTSNVYNMNKMFFRASSFNQDLNDWKTQNVTEMKSMFRDAILFNGDISKWNVEKVTDVENMFRGAKKFDQNLSNWNLKSVKKIRDFAKGSMIENNNQKLPKALAKKVVKF